MLYGYFTLCEQNIYLVMLFSVKWTTPNKAFTTVYSFFMKNPRDFSDRKIRGYPLAAKSVQ